MVGLKNMAQIVSGEVYRGCFDPAYSIINFAVPSPSKLRSFNYTQFPPSLHPGVIHEALQTHNTYKSIVNIVYHDTRNKQ